jgi:collagenase-like PrtC family protease
VNPSDDKNSPVELLCPAGGWDSLKAAVSEGADAVYLGVGDYNARRRADNFKSEEFKEVAGYCHGRGVRCYLAANTLVKNGELQKWHGMVESAYSAGFDAVIIQEISFIGHLKESFPDLGVHVSTQAGVFNSHWGGLLKGADRVIMPREMTLNQVRDFKRKTGLPVEVFVQGALCFSISGQCLMSSFLGGRSGNRGLCAQPCRKRYNGHYLLSTRDLCLIGKLPEIAEAGVCSIKVEGRLRSPEYVGAAAAAYRRALDSLQAGRFSVDWGAYADLELSFNREFTLGGLFKEYDVVASDDSGKRGVYLGCLGEGGNILLDSALLVGDGVRITTGKGVHGDLIRSIEKGGRQVSRAEKGDRVRLKVNAHAGDGLYVTSGAARRKAYAVRQKPVVSFERRAVRAGLPSPSVSSFDGVKLLVKVYSLKDAYSVLEAGATHAFYNVFAKDYPRGEQGISPYIPRCLFEWAADEAIESVSDIRPAAVLSGDLGVASRIAGCETYVDISCNAFNDIDVGFFNGRGMVPVISPELTFSELGRFSDKRFAVYCHGRIPLMSTKYALKDGRLRDDAGYTFPVSCELDQRRLLNSVPYGLYGEVIRLRDEGIVYYLLDLDDAPAETVSEYLRILAGSKIKKPSGYTLGHFKTGVT